VHHHVLAPCIAWRPALNLGRLHPLLAEAQTESCWSWTRSLDGTCCRAVICPCHRGDKTYLLAAYSQQLHRGFSGPTQIACCRALLSPRPVPQEKPLGSRMYQGRLCLLCMAGGLLGHGTRIETACCFARRARWMAWRSASYARHACSTPFCPPDAHLMRT